MYSEDSSAPSVSVDPVMLSIDAEEQVNFAATLQNAPEAYRLIWSFNDGTKSVNEEELTISHTYKNAGYYLGSVSLVDSKDQKRVLAKAEFGIRVDDPEFPEDSSLQELEQAIETTD